MTDIPRFKQVSNIHFPPNTNVIIDVTAIPVIDDGEGNDYQSAFDSLERIAKINVFDINQLQNAGIKDSSDKEANRPNAFRQMFDKLKII